MTSIPQIESCKRRTGCGSKRKYRSVSRAVGIDKCVIWKDEN